MKIIPTKIIGLNTVRRKISGLLLCVATILFTADHLGDILLGASC